MVVEPEVAGVVTVVGTLVDSDLVEGVVAAVVEEVPVSGGDDATEVTSLLVAGGGGAAVLVEDGGGVLTTVGTVLTMGVEMTEVVDSEVIDEVVVTTDEELAGGGVAEVPHSVTVTVTVLTEKVVSVKVRQ